MNLFEKAKANGLTFDGAQGFMAYETDDLGNITVDFDGIRILATHGHKYGVKSNLLRFLMAAKENAVQIALFGHTHCAYCELIDDIWLLNPGSCGYRSRGTYGIIEISDHKITCSIKELKEGK